MFKTFASSIFLRRQTADAGGPEVKMTRTELQDLFRTEFDNHNSSAVEITARHANRRPQAYAA